MKHKSILIGELILLVLFLGGLFFVLQNSSGSNGFSSVANISSRELLGALHVQSQQAFERDPQVLPTGQTGGGEEQEVMAGTEREGEEEAYQSEQEGNKISKEIATVSVPEDSREEQQYNQSNIQEADFFISEPEFKDIVDQEVAGQEEQLFSETDKLEDETNETDIKEKQEEKPLLSEEISLKEASSSEGEVKVDINMAGHIELQQLHGIGPAIAQRVIDYRNEHGLFADPEDIKRVKGIGEITFEKMQGQIVVGDVPVSSSSSPDEDLCREGQININTASVEELDEIVHIGFSRAQDIINVRPFDSLEDLARVKGISEGRVNDIQTEGKACVR